MDTLQYAKNITERQLVHKGWIPELARWMVNQVIANLDRPDAYHALVALYVNQSNKADTAYT